jgi:hypothetical protein
MHRTGDALDDDLQDPAMNDVVQRLQNAHAKMYKEMMEEIEEALDQEYTNGNF